MKETWLLTQAENPKSKLQAIRLSPVSKYKEIEFGQAGSRDFTTTGDEKLKDAYLARHKPREDWSDLETAGAWSRWLLWNEPTIAKSIVAMEKRFKIRIGNAT